MRFRRITFLIIRCARFSHLSVRNIKLTEFFSSLVSLQKIGATKIAQSLMKFVIRLFLNSILVRYRRGKAFATHRRPLNEAK